MAFAIKKEILKEENLSLTGSLQNRLLGCDCLQFSTHRLKLVASTRARNERPLKSCDLSNLKGTRAKVMAHFFGI